MCVGATFGNGIGRVMRVLAIDIGNTRLSMGIYDGHRLGRRFDTLHESEAESFFRGERGECGVCVVSRVSRCMPDLEKFLSEQLSFRVLPLTAEVAPIRLNYETSVGSDRIANALAARRYAPGGAIVVDLGTATHFDIVDEKGDFYGGPIMAGIQTLHEALSMRIPHLPQRGLHRVERAVVDNTADAMNAGAILSCVGAIERIVQEIRQEFHSPYRLILTGGNAVYVQSMLHADDVIPNLTLDGLNAFGQIAIRKMGIKYSA